MRYMTGRHKWSSPTNEALLHFLLYNFSTCHQEFSAEWCKNMMQTPCLVLGILINDSRRKKAGRYIFLRLFSLTLQPLLLFADNSLIIPIAKSLSMPPRRSIISMTACMSYVWLHVVRENSTSNNQLIRI